MTLAQLQRQLLKIQTELSTLGSIHPGSLSEQYNVCGTPGCHCKDAKKPQKHGPYYQLNYTWRGKSRTRFVRAPELERMQEKLVNYKRFRELTVEWVDVAIALEALEREEARQAS